MEGKLCPVCGAYWKCDCKVEDLAQPLVAGCPHDWIEAVGVEVLDYEPEESKVLVCRLCGIYSVRHAA